MSKGEKETLKGDKLRELIHLVYLNSKYGTGKARISRLKEALGYSTGGIYNALDESGFFDRKGDEINLTSKGVEYAERTLLPYFSAFNPIAYMLMFLGTLCIFQWYLWISAHALIFDWHVGTVLIVGGIVLRFFLLRLVFWAHKLKKQL